MAKPSISAIFMVSSLVIALQISGTYAMKEAGLEAEEETWFQHISRGNENLIKLHFYLQDALGGPNATVYEVARANITATSPSSFGQVRVFDDLLTAKPDRDSEEVGRSQGTVISSDFATVALTTVHNFYFTAEAYKGSNICVLGRNQLDMEYRELAVVGGTGFFRFARGYAIEKTYSYDEAKDYAVQEWTVHVTHFSHSA